MTTCKATVIKDADFERLGVLVARLSILKSTKRKIEKNYNWLSMDDRLSANGIIAREGLARLDSEITILTNEKRSVQYHCVKALRIESAKFVKCHDFISVIDGDCK